MNKDLMEAVKMYLGEKNDKEVSHTLFAELSQIVSEDSIADIRFLTLNNCRCSSTDAGGDCEWCQVYYRVNE